MIDVKLIGAPAFAVRVEGEDFVYVGLNDRLSLITGLDPAAIVGRRPQDCLAPEVAATVLARYRACVASKQAAESEMYLEGREGACWWSVTVTPVLDAKGDVARLVGVSTDITARRLAERKQREAETRMALAIDVLDGGFWHADLATGIVDASPRLVRLMTGIDAERLAWKAFVARVHPDDRDRVERAGRLADDAEPVTVEYRIRVPGAEERWLRSKCRAVPAEAGSAGQVVGVVTDVTESKRVEALYTRQAMTDPLTGLANRRGFDADAERFAEQASRAGTRFGLVVLDLDAFKPINDRYGHATGDAVLRDLASRLAGVVRPQDMVARIGGDEFAILVADVAEGDLPALAERLLLAVGRPVATPAGPVAVGVSLGLGTSRPDDMGIEDLAARADAALYAAKSAGRGAWRMAA